MLEQFDDWHEMENQQFDRPLPRGLASPYHRSFSDVQQP